MGENMGDDPGIAPCSRGGWFGCRRGMVAPEAAGQFEHAAEQAAGWAAAQADLAVVIAEQKNGAEADRARGFFRLARQVGDAALVRGAGALPGAEQAGRAAWGAECGAEIEQGLRKITRMGARVALGAELGGGGGDGGFGGGEWGFDGEQAGGDPFDIAIDRHHRQRKRDGADGGGGIGADAGQAAQTLNRGGKRAARGNDAGTGDQIAGAGIIAQSGPEIEHLIIGGGGEIGDGGKMLEKTLEIGYDGGDRGLLEHDFAEPDPVGIGSIALGGAPGQVAPMRLIPAE